MKTLQEYPENSLLSWPMLRTLFTFALQSAKYKLPNTLQFWESGADQKMENSFHLGLFLQTTFVAIFFFFYVISIFQAVTGGVLKKKPTAKKAIPPADISWLVLEPVLKWCGKVPSEHKSYLWECSFQWATCSTGLLPHTEAATPHRSDKQEEPTQETAPQTLPPMSGRTDPLASLTLFRSSLPQILEMVWNSWVVPPTLSLGLRDHEESWGWRGKNWC